MMETWKKVAIGASIVAVLGLAWLVSVQTAMAKGKLGVEPPTIADQEPGRLP